jgi:hypothetical protein
MLAMIVIMAFNPACLNEDTLDQWQQSATNSYNNWHPALLSIIWHYLRFLYNGFQAGICLQVLAFGVGAMLAFRVRTSVMQRSALLFVAALLPPVFAYLGFLGKDSAMACFLTLAIGLCLHYHDTHRAWAFWGAILASFFGYSVRQDGILPVLFVLAALWYERRKRAKDLWLVIPTVIIFAAMNGFVRTSFRVQPAYPQQGVMLYDLAALGVASGTVPAVPPEFSASAADQRRIPLDQYNCGWLFWGERRIFQFTKNERSLHRLGLAWIEEILDHPIPYLKWRWLVFSSYAGFRPLVLQPLVESCVVPNQSGVASVPTAFHRSIMRVLNGLGQSVFFRAWVYLTILWAIIAYGFWKRRWELSLLALSGAVGSATYFVTLCTASFRFACFTVFAAVILMLRLLAEQLEFRAETQLVDASAHADGGRGVQP